MAGGTWVEVGPGRSVYRPAGPGEWKIGPDALVPYLRAEPLEVLEHIRERWEREFWPRFDALAARVEAERGAGGD